VAVLLGDASGGIVDIDLDFDCARRAGPLFLPKTNAKFGRAGAPSSHWLYRIANPGKTEQRRVRGDMSVEYRANGAMTVVPPSIHKETGETIEWNEAGTIATVTRDELIAAINGLLKAHTTKRGQLLMTIWHIQNFDAVPKDYTDSLEAVLKEYPAPESPR
jgi:hypothetical protein